MSELKHTPGPWKTGDDLLLHSVISEQGIVCKLYDNGEIKPARRMKNSEANARLIAAAPELLEVCELIAEENSVEMTYHNYQKLLTAIEKATS